MNRSLWILALILWGVNLALAQIRIDEVLADPNSVSDTQGEFVELFATQDWSGDLQFVLEQDTLGILGLSLKKNDRLLLCSSDSVWEQKCVKVPQFTLVNSRPLFLGLLNEQKQWMDSSTVPEAKAGVSWGRTAQKTWELTQDNYLNTSEKISPLVGDAHLDSSLVNLQLFSTVNRFNAQEVKFFLSQKSLQGVGSFSHFKLEYSPQWNDQWVLIDSLLWNGETPYYTWNSGSSAYLVKITAYGDQSLSQNTVSLLVPSFNQTSYPLIISEIYPFASGDESEWFEVYNTSESPIWTDFFGVRSGSQKEMLPHAILEAHQRCVFVQDSVSFREKYGAARLCLKQIPSWPTLSDAGDSLIFYQSELGEFQWSSWPSAKEADKAYSLIPQENSFDVFKGNRLGGTPGFAENTSSIQSVWKPAKRMWSLSQDQFLKWDVNLDFALKNSFKVVDYRGNVWFEQDYTQPNTLVWDFTINGKTFPFGPFYLVYYQNRKVVERVSLVLTQ